MATIRSYTDVDQSKKLAEILPIESADMLYWKGEYITHSYMEGQHKDEQIPVWSLAALLDIIPKHIKDCNVLRTDIGENDFSIWYNEVGYGVNDKLPDITMECPVDACVEMILKLKELKLI